jgi:nitroreductase
MKKRNQLLMVSAIIAFLLIPTTIIPQSTATSLTPSDIVLPPPITIDMIMEQSICRRVSYRAYTTQAPTDDELSTVLWAAYGYLDNGNRTIYHPSHTYSTVIYVIRSDATYKYIPENHTLSLWKNGNYLYIGQNTGAPIKFGLCWDKNIIPDEKDAMAEIGMTAQNVYFDANALNLATITTGTSVNDLYDLGLPSNEKPEIIMHLGHPSPPYNFNYNPLPPANLPAIENNTMTLAQAIENRQIATSWAPTPLTLLQESQLIWASYGTSYLYDNVNHKRHRTLPSAIDIYPFFIYAANETGVYLYNPEAHSLSTIVTGDHRTDIATAIGSMNFSVETAPWILIAFLDTVHGSSQYMPWWYYEAGAIMHNILIEAGTLGLTANIEYNIADPAGLRTALGIASHTTYVPEAVGCIGTPALPENHPPNKPTINGTSSGKAKTQYNFTIQATDPDGDNVSYYLSWGDGTNTGWQSPVASGQPATIMHSWAKKGTYTVSGKAKDSYGAESQVATLKVTMPLVFDSTFSFWAWLLHSFPHAFPLLRLLLNK